MAVNYIIYPCCPTKLHSGFCSSFIAVSITEIILNIVLTLPDQKLAEFTKPDKDWTLFTGNTLVKFRFSDTNHTEIAHFRLH